MSYFIRLNFLIGIVLISFLVKPSAAQTYYDPEVTPSLKRILVNGDSVIFNLDSLGISNAEVKHTFVLNYRNNNITFEVQPADSINFQFFLEGFDKEWSGWKKINSKDYTNLPAGKYLFKIRYISSSSSGGETSLLSLRVLPLWYFSQLAIILYIIFFSLIIWFLYVHFNLRFARRLHMLEQIINK